MGTALKRRLALLPLCLAVAGCPGDGNGDDDDGTELTCETVAQEDATCTLGTGPTTYVSLEDGDDLDIEQGAQGGFHIFGSIRVTGVLPGDPDDPQGPDSADIDFTVTTDDGTEVGRARLRGPLKVRSDGQVELVGEVVPLDIDQIDDVAWQEATFAVTVDDACGTSVNDERRVVLTPGS